MSIENDIAAYMLNKLNKDGVLYQEEIVNEIHDTYGEQYTYINENGNLAIARNILNKFKTLTHDIVVWDRSEKMWRKRESFDDEQSRNV